MHGSQETHLQALTGLIETTAICKRIPRFSRMEIKKYMPKWKLSQLVPSKLAGH